MPVTPTGAMGIRFAAVKTLISGSETFQELLGVEEEEEPEVEAAEKVFIIWEDGETDPPFAVVGVEDELTRRAVSSAPDDVSVDAPVTVLLLAPVPEDYVDSKEDQYYWFDNMADAIVVEMLEGSIAVGILISEIRSGQIQRVEPVEQISGRGLFMQQAIRIIG